jgi:hypothetical protein
MSKYFVLLPWQLLQWQIAWPLDHAPFQRWFWYCTPDKVILYNSEHLQGHIQQPKNGDCQLLTVQLSYSTTASFLTNRVLEAAPVSPTVLEVLCFLILSNTWNCW